MTCVNRLSQSRIDMACKVVIISTIGKIGNSLR
jgi:hypothetical protein